MHLKLEAFNSEIGSNERTLLCDQECLRPDRLWYHSPSHTEGTKDIPPDVKRPEREPDNLPFSNSEVINSSAVLTPVLREYVRRQAYTAYVIFYLKNVNCDYIGRILCQNFIISFHR
jgi:hypothetical protein